MIIVTTVALLVLAGALMVVISKTWASHCRGEGFSIDDLVADEVLRLRQQEAFSAELGASAQPAELKVDIKPRPAG